MITLIVIIVICAVIYFIGLSIISSNAKKKNATKKALLEEKYKTLKSVNNFFPTKRVGHKNFIFAIDETNSKVAIVERYRTKIIPFEQILKVEYIENATTVASKSSIRTVGGAIVGGAIAGGAGAIVGGLSGDTTMKNKISLMQVKITLRDIQEPSICLKLIEYDYEGGFDPSSDAWSEVYKENKKIVNNIVDSLSVIIDKVDKENQNNKVSVTESSNQSIADELSKLVKLKESGVLTENEFEEQKQKLLNK